MVGLGWMGANMFEDSSKAGHQCTVFVFEEMTPAKIRCHAFGGPISVSDEHEACLNAGGSHRQVQARVKRSRPAGGQQLKRIFCFAISRSMSLDLLCIWDLTRKE